MSVHLKIIMLSIFIWSCAPRNIAKSQQKDNYLLRAELTEVEWLKLKNNIMTNSNRPHSVLSRFDVRSEAGLQGLPEDALVEDTDRDGLSDDVELLLGTNPKNPDTDGDALIDSWEVGTVNGLDLKAWGASPLHKDIFVEMDYMVRESATNGIGPNENVIRRIIEIFKLAPVHNPDGQSGINIHLVLDDSIEYDPDLFPLFDEFEAIKRKYFEAKRAPIFHYMVWANGYNGDRSSGYSMDIPHSDFIVTLGKWNGGRGGTDDQKVGTFIHELGHNLGFMHGGSEDLNYKPNYLSVMNYFYQMSGVLRLVNGVRIAEHTYQQFNLPSLNELQVMERDGLGKYPFLNGYLTRFFNQNGQVVELACHNEIDWSWNNTIDDYSISSDLNGDGNLSAMEKTGDEWNSIKYNGGVIGSFMKLKGIIDQSVKQYTIQPFIELKEQVVQQLNLN